MKKYIITLLCCLVTSYSHANELTPVEQREMQESLQAEQYLIHSHEAMKVAKKPRTDRDEVFSILEHKDYEVASKVTGCTTRVKDSIPSAAQSSRLHTYKGSDGSVLLSSLAPTLSPDAKNKATASVSDLIAQGCDYQEYRYVGTTAYTPIAKKVTTSAKDLYKLKMCKIGDAYVPCYKYAKTIPSQTYYEKRFKDVKVSPKVVLDEAKKAAED